MDSPNRDKSLALPSPSKGDLVASQQNPSTTHDLLTKMVANSSAAASAGDGDPFDKVQVSTVVVKVLDDDVAQLSVEPIPVITGIRIPVSAIEILCILSKILCGISDPP